ncbi:MAG: TlpA family protein disulfide reductase [Ignavibacteria bacterium]|nr:TlpA family protein disulfide reductase [Ignavibacteria bacterium]
MKKLLILILIIPSILNIQCQSSKKDSVKFSYIESMSNDITPNYIPDFTYELNGYTKYFSELTGKVILINFWNTKTAESQKEVQELNKLYNEYKSKGIEVIGICISEENPEYIPDYLENYKINYLILYANENHKKGFEYSISSNLYPLPISVIVDRGGKIRELIIGKRNYSEFKNLIEKYL